MINVPSDLRKNKEAIIGNMDLRESICLFLGLMLAIGILYYIRVILGYKRIVIAAFIGGIFIIPFLFIGFKKINGMKVDDYFKIFINNKIIANEKRLPICSSKEEVVKKKKFELIRYYKLYLRKELINLRGYLKGKGLILTEYIDYNNERYAIFRLNGKDLILEQIKKNKEEIESKKKEIKTFINDVIKKVKSEKITLTKKNKVARKKQYKEIKEHKKEKVKNLYKKVNLLKLELKALKNKTFEELKNGVDIFENVPNIYAKRIAVKSVNKKEKIILDNIIVNLRKSINEDERNLYQLNLFSKRNLRDFIESIDNKIVFINSDDKVNVYVNKNVENESILVDLTEVDKENDLYTGSIISLEARNFYNHYRSINNLEEIL